MAAVEKPSWASRVGPDGDRYRWTATDVLERLAGARERVAGRHVLVTGGSSGIGVPTVAALVRGGAARVVVGVRDVAKARAALEDVGADVVAGVELHELDLESLGSVRTFAAAMRGPLHLVVLNAGVMMPAAHTITVDGYELQHQVNWLSNHLLANLLAPRMLEAARLVPAGHVRLVIVSSCAHLGSDLLWDDYGVSNYNKRTAYGSSKTGAIYLAHEFDRIHATSGIRAFPLHPGGIMTGLQKNMPLTEQRKLGWIDADGKANTMFKSVDGGASTSLFAATAPELDSAEGPVYLEDCHVSIPSPAFPIGFAPYTIDTTAWARSWKVANEMVSENFAGPLVAKL